jgi:hypothetical protein
MHPNMAAAFSAYVFRAIQASLSMPPLVARIVYAGALLVAIPIAIVTFLLTLLSAAVLLLVARWRRDPTTAHGEGPVVIEGEYSVVAEPPEDEAERARRVTRNR